MTGLDDAMVSDIGGTTTDVAVLDGGRPRLDPEGATVGGFRTMVEAVAMRTFGLGGDSEVALEDGRARPRTCCSGRAGCVPLSLAGMAHGAAVRGPSWSASCARPIPAASTAASRCAPACRTGSPPGLTPPEAKLYEAIGTVPLPLDTLLTSTAQSATLNRLVARGLVHVAGFTPSDAAHVLGRQANWDAATARLGAELFVRRRDGRGQAIAPSPEGFLRARADGADAPVGRSDPRNRLRRRRARRRRHRGACAGAARGRRQGRHRPAVASRSTGR